MDPLSISFGALSAITLSYRLLTVCKFVGETRHRDRAVDEWRVVLETLVSVLEKVERQFNHAGENQDIQLREHYESITPIIRSCSTTINGLLVKLPDHTSNPNMLRQAYDQLRVEMTRDTTRTQLSYIQTYIQCLGTLLTAVAAGTQWQMQASQGKLEGAIRHLSDDIGSLRRSFDAATQQTLQTSCLTLELESDDDGSLSNSTVENDPTVRSIRNYIDSTALLAERLTTGSMCSSAAVTVTGIMHAASSNNLSSSFEPPFALRSCPPRQILESQISYYMEDIEKFRRVRLFEKAENDLLQLISLKAKLEEHYGVPFDDRRKMEMTHAEILYDKGIDQSLDIAQTMVQQLLQQSTELQERCTLCYFLAAIYVKQGRFEEAKDYAQHALSIQMELASNSEVLRESYLLLEQIHQSLREYPAARTYREILETQYTTPSERQGTASIAMSPAVSVSGPPTESNDSSINIYDWLERHGFDQRAPHPFGEPHPVTNRFPLHVAIERKNKGIVRELMRRGVSFENVDDYGATALLQAASTQCVDIVRMILDHVTNDNNSIDVNATDKHGYNVLHYAAKRKGDTSCVELLLNASPPVDINHKNRQGRTPLHEAVEKGNTELVKALLRRSSLDLDMCDNALDTACHIAVKEHREEILCHLLNAGASVIIEDGEGNDVEGAIKMTWSMDPTIVSQVKSRKEQQRLSAARQKAVRQSSMSSSRPSVTISSSRNGSTFTVGTTPATSPARTDSRISYTTEGDEAESSRRGSRSSWHPFRRRV